MMTSSLHQADVILIMSTVHIYYAHYSGLLFMGRATHPGEEDAWGAWADALPESDGECGHVRRPILTSFSPVASSLPPLDSGMVKTQF